MKKVKILASLLALAMVIIILCNCTYPATYITEYEKGLGNNTVWPKYSCFVYTRVKVDYDFHVEYGEVINIQFSMVRNPKDSYSIWMTDDALTISLPDGEHYDVVGTSAYVIEDYYDDKYEVQESKGDYPINVHFAVKITDPNFEEEQVQIQIKFRCRPEDSYNIGGVGLGMCDEDGWVVMPFSVFRFISDDNGVVIYYYTGKNGDHKRRFVRSF